MDSTQSLRANKHPQFDARSSVTLTGLQRGMRCQISIALGITLPTLTGHWTAAMRVPSPSPARRLHHDLPLLCPCLCPVLASVLASPPAPVPVGSSSLLPCVVTQRMWWPISAERRSRSCRRSNLSSVGGDRRVSCRSYIAKMEIEDDAAMANYLPPTPALAHLSSGLGIPNGSATNSSMRSGRWDIPHLGSA